MHEQEAEAESRLLSRRDRVRIVASNQRERL